MRKNILSLSIAAMIGGLGLAGGAATAVVQAKPKPEPEGCDKCRDPDGVTCFPVYGLGPHTHAPGPMIGSTRLLEDQSAIGFTPDPDEPGMGTWWCPYCGDGRAETPNVPPR